MNGYAQIKREFLACARNELKTEMKKRGLPGIPVGYVIFDRALTLMAKRIADYRSNERKHTGMPGSKELTQHEPNI